jgi:hypothetical protein
MRIATIALLTGTLIAGAACATGGERTGGSTGVLEAEEIRAAGPQIRTALDAVEQLRPQYLRTRANPTVGGRRVDPVRVYVNGTLWGDPDSLTRIRAEEVVRIRYIRPSDAQTRFGMDHGSGALEVSTSAR